MINISILSGIKVTNENLKYAALYEYDAKNEKGFYRFVVYVKDGWKTNAKQSQNINELKEIGFQLNKKDLIIAIVEIEDSLPYTKERPNTNFNIQLERNYSSYIKPKDSKKKNEPNELPIDPEKKEEVKILTRGSYIRIIIVINEYCKVTTRLIEEIKEYEISDFKGQQAKEKDVKGHVIFKPHIIINHVERNTAIPPLGLKITKETYNYTFEHGRDITDPTGKISIPDGVRRSLIFAEYNLLDLPKTSQIQTNQIVLTLSDPIFSPNQNKEWKVPWKSNGGSQIHISPSEKWGEPTGGAVEFLTKRIFERRQLEVDFEFYKIMTSTKAKPIINIEKDKSTEITWHVSNPDGNFEKLFPIVYLEGKRIKVNDLKHTILTQNTDATNFVIFEIIIGLTPLGLFLDALLLYNSIFNDQDLLGNRLTQSEKYTEAALILIPFIPELRKLIRVRKFNDQISKQEINNLKKQLKSILNDIVITDENEDLINLIKKELGD